MFSKTLVLLLLSVTGAFAAPAKQVNLDDIQCRCLTFSTSAAPTHCIYQELLTLDWETAYSLATADDLKIQFASDKAISNVLSILKPLPATVLDTVHQGKMLPLDPSKEIRSENRLICGFGNDLEYVESQGAGLKPEIHYVGTVLGLFMLLFIVYLAAEYIWVRLTTARPNRIMLEGEEKVLTADLLYDSHDGASQHTTEDPSTHTPSSKRESWSNLWPLVLCGSWGPTRLALSQHYQISAGQAIKRPTM